MSLITCVFTARSVPTKAQLFRFGADLLCSEHDLGGLMTDLRVIAGLRLLNVYVYFLVISCFNKGPHSVGTGVTEFSILRVASVWMSNERVTGRVGFI